MIRYWASLVAQLVKNLPAVQETQVQSGKILPIRKIPSDQDQILPIGRFLPVRKIPWRRKWETPPACLPGKSHRQRNLVGCSPRGTKKLGTAE